MGERATISNLLEESSEMASGESEVCDINLEPPTFSS
jgi:hypothetical protein